MVKQVTHTAESPLPKILHVSGRSFWCGESNRVLVVCRGLHERGWPVLLGAPASSAIAQRALAEGLPVDTGFAFRRGFRPLSILRDVLRLRRLRRENRCDVIHLHTSVDMWVAALAFGFSRRQNGPVVIRTRHSDHHSKSDPVHQWLYRRAVDHVVLAAGALRKPLDGLIRRGALNEERMTVIHSSVNIHRFDPARVSGDAVRRELGLEGKCCIGLVGRISREKGHDLLLAALPALLKLEPNLVCVFAGEGDQEERLRRETASGPLRDHVRFAGFRSDIPEVMAAMDLLVVPSLRVEASPGVVKEAMAMNKPVVAADVGGVSEIIRHGVDGWVIPPGDVPALEAALAEWLRRPDRRQAPDSGARERVMREFSDERLVDNNIALYRRLTGGGR
ncbi:MAG TPA: glycosyltransferase family 4 protein [Kiritimatiellia bacterium]|nr:glycosyltransferase family 4 protein [Kiritimatiellia bacterium]